MSINYNVHLYTEGSYICKDILADTKEEALFIADNKWENANFGKLEDCDIEYAKAVETSDGHWEVTIRTNGFYSCTIESKTEMEEEDILQKAENEHWHDANFGELTYLEVTGGKIVDSWELI